MPKGDLEILRKVRKRIYERRVYLIMEKELATNYDRGADMPKRIEVREGHGEEAASLRPEAERRLRSYVARGYRCGIVSSDGEVIGWLWWTDGRTASTNAGAGRRDEQVRFFDVDLADDDAWGFEYHIIPSHRGKGRATPVLRAIEALLAKEGYRRMLGYVDIDNVAARWLYETNGHRRIRTVTARYFVSLFGFSQGRLVVRSNQRRQPATHPYRPL